MPDPRPSSADVYRLVIVPKKPGLIRRATAKLQARALRVPSVCRYIIGRCCGRVPAEPELTFRQKLTSFFILPGTRTVPSPAGLFQGSRRNLRVIDDVSNYPNVIWVDHPHNEIKPPRCPNGSSPKGLGWRSPRASFVLEVENGFVGPSGVVFTEEVLLRNAKWYYELLPRHVETRRFDRLITFIQLWSDRFIHFSFDTLPRVAIAYDFIRRNPDLLILIPESTDIIQVFRELGFDRSRLVLHKKNIFYAAKYLYYPHLYNNGHPQQMGLLPLGSLENVRYRLMGDPAETRNTVVYLKRRASQKRSVENEDDLLHSVRDRLSDGLELVVFEPVNDWRIDREILKRARVVMGPHGGAWCNILFCQKGTHVIEFLPLVHYKAHKRNERPCFYGLANALDLDYWLVEPTKFAFEKAGMNVPVDEVLSVLNAIGVLRGNHKGAGRDN